MAPNSFVAGNIQNLLQHEQPPPSQSLTARHPFLNQFPATILVPGKGQSSGGIPASIQVSTLEHTYLQAQSGIFTNHRHIASSAITCRHVSGHRRSEEQTGPLGTRNKSVFTCGWVDSPPRKTTAKVGPPRAIMRLSPSPVVGYAVAVVLAQPR